MICHKSKVIFIHIPRTAGTSVEKAFVGKDWFNIDVSTKHIYASTARDYYAEFWDEYFKFSIVRNPWDRMLSLSKFPHFYGVVLK